MRKQMEEALIAAERKKYHKRLLKGVLCTNSNGVPSNADKDSNISVRIACGIAEQLFSEAGERLAGQTSGSEFETINTEFIKNTFLELQHIRPGHWDVRKIGNRNRMGIAQFEQYAHLVALDEAAKHSKELAAALGRDYTITPDVIITRGLMTDEELNSPFLLVDGSVCNRAALREANGGKLILHASISSKWTIRSDRSQNSRSEALNLIRNRKGHLPHIVVVAGEPLPSRLASIALGTGDIDCVYHFALPELINAAKDAKDESALDMLNIMIDGKRLKDISDLPLDLAI